MLVLVRVSFRIFLPVLPVCSALRGSRDSLTIGANNSFRQLLYALEPLARNAALQLNASLVAQELYGSDGDGDADGDGDVDSSDASMDDFLNADDLDLFVSYSSSSSSSTQLPPSSPPPLATTVATTLVTLATLSTSGSKPTNRSVSRVSADVPIWVIPCYSIILLCAVVGNLLVVLTLVQNRRMRTITNVFLLNLAISDILLGVLCMPVTLVGTLLRNFIFGEFLCKFIPFAQGKQDTFSQSASVCDNVNECLRCVLLSALSSLIARSTCPSVCLFVCLSSAAIWRGRYPGKSSVFIVLLCYPECEEH